MFRVSQHPSSRVLKTVPAASGTGHSTCTATPFQRGLIGTGLCDSHNSVNWIRLMTLLQAETFLLFLSYTYAGWGVLKRERNNGAFPGDAIQLNVSPLYCVDNSVDTCHLDATCNLQTTRRRTCTRAVHYGPSYVRNACVVGGVRSQGHMFYQFCLRELKTVTCNSEMCHPSCVYK